MKRFLLSLVLATSLALTSCSDPFDDSAIWDMLNEHEETIKDHEQRIVALEELCKQMNTNISSLQTIIEALQNNDYVTAVVPIVKDGITIGYTITFAKSGSVTIYHGQDGKDGANGADGKDGKDGVDGKDGKDGYTPQIGVKQDTDGVYYWTLDGEWLLDENGNKIKAVGTDGKDGQNGADGSNGNDGQNGSDGKDGQDGKDGKDGITPQLKIEEDYWYISYDNGATWTKLGKATGEDGQNGTNGKDGANGSDGDSFFQSVTQNEECVYLTLADGTIITLPKHKAEAANRKIYYTTSDGKKIFPYTTEPAIFGAILVSNVYEDGQGVLTFDDTITSIGNHAFKGCTSLTSVTIGNSVTSIGSYAFRYCTSLTSVTIPNSVTLIEYDAFCDCTSLTSVYCKPTTPPAGGFYMFDNNASDRKIYVPAESVEAYIAATYWKDYADYIVSYDFEKGEIVTPIVKEVVLEATQIQSLIGNGYSLADGTPQDVTNEATWLKWTAGSLDFEACRVLYNAYTDRPVYNGCLQFQGDAANAAKQGFIGNATSNGEIMQVIIEAYSSYATPSFNVYYGDAKLPKDSAKVLNVVDHCVKGESKGMDGNYEAFSFTCTFDIPAGNEFFAVRNDSKGATYIKSITVKY